MRADPLILAGDIGGTKTTLALFTRRDGHLRRLRDGRYPSDPSRRPEHLLAEFLGPDRASISAICLGVAGLVVDGSVNATNLPWSLDERELSELLKVPLVGLINDLEANARGLSALSAEDLEVIQEGSSSGADDAGSDATRGLRVGAMISAGTGLGQASFVRTGARVMVFPSEAGHGDLAPVDRDDLPLLQALWQKYGHVSIERVLSGPGIVEMYHIMKQLPGSPPADRAVAEAIALEEDAAAEITGAALKSRCPLCELVLHKFVRFYGAEAGNLALRMLVSEGIYIGGGIAPKILPALRSGLFLRSFLDKGRMRGFLETVRLTIVLNEETALLGAARHAFSLLDAHD